MALWQDESYLNRYLLDFSPRLIDACYCKPEEYPGACRAILRDKNKVLGRQCVDQIKAAFVDSRLSYLRGKDMRLHPLHLIKTNGRLGNQMFQYAFLLALKRTILKNGSACTVMEMGTLVI